MIMLKKYAMGMPKSEERKKQKEIATQIKDEIINIWNLKLKTGKWVEIRILQRGDSWKTIYTHQRNEFIAQCRK